MTTNTAQAFDMFFTDEQIQTKGTEKSTAEGSDAPLPVASSKPKIIKADKVEEKLLSHPGEILKTKYLDRNALSISQAARDMDMPANRLAAIVKGERSITANTAVRLGLYFNTPALTWLQMQMNYDLQQENTANLQDLKSRVRPFLKSA